MRRALLICYEPSHFIELRRVARLLAASGTWEPVMYFAKTYPDTAERATYCTAEGWSVRVEAPEPTTTHPPAPPKTSPARSAFRALPEPIQRPVHRVFNITGRYAAARFALQAAADHAIDVLAEECASLVVLPEDNVDHRTSVMVKTAAARRIPSVIVPFTIANELEPAEAYYGNPAYTLGPLERMLFAGHPEWIVEHRGAQLVRMPVLEALALERMGYAPPRPWILNSGFADAIAVESDAMLAHYRACRLPESQLVVTGALYDDDLAAAIRDRERTRTELGLDRRPVTLCALPPDQLATRTSDQCEFAAYEDLVRAWITTLCRRDVQVVVSLHPRTRAADVAFVEALGARIANLDVARLIPACDVYAASASATIRMAIACGKPVINYDVYRYHYTDYVGVPGVFTMQSREEFQAIVEQLASNPTARADAAAKQRGVMERWGRLDGRAGERMLALFDRLRGNG
jgi:hypothetical protein